MKHSMTKRTFSLIVSSLWLALTFSQIAFGAQEPKAKNLNSALTQTTVTAQESKVTDPDAALTATAFTYQGQLKDANGPVIGSFDFLFVLYSAQTGGERLGTSEMKDGALTNGLFSFKLDFGREAVETQEPWLEIAVRYADSHESYTVLSPRQKLTSTPYALFAQHEPWSLIGVPVGFRGSVAEPVAVDGTLNPSMTHEAAAEQAVKSMNAWKDEPGSVAPTLAAAPQNTVNFIAKFDNRGSPLTDSIMYDNGSNVGIGTTTPNHRLSIAGGPVWTSNGWKGAVELESGAAIAWKANNTNNQRFGLGHTGGGLFMFRTMSDPGTAGSAAMYDFMINDAGNVGIGTINPLTKLTVQTAAGNYGFIHTDGTITVGSYVGGSQSGAVGGWLGTRSNHQLHFFTNNGQSSMTIATSGNVGIGTVNPGFKLDVAGTIRAANVGVPSDARLKANVTTLTQALEKLEQLRGVAFQWNALAAPLGHTPGQRDIGVIAQEVEAVFPELINTSKTDGYKGVDYSRLTAVLIEAVKELRADNEAKAREIQALQERLAALEQLVKERQN
ncbi:MAG: tail fiber domain-containing protein [Acidobacteria bacterium]|nr:tail fiber domain-containing protein [Acidobacteriota bacterium]